MSPKEKRARLFRKNRPFVRPLQVYDGNDYSRDIKILWVAYQKKQFTSLPENMQQAEFAAEIEKASRDHEFFMVEDRNPSYEGNGPIAVVWLFNDGWKIRPHTEFFAWTTRLNKLRSTVSFLQMLRYKKIGCCLIESLKESKILFDKCTEYGVLHYVGMIHNGDPRGDEYLYSIRGKR